MIWGGVRQRLVWRTLKPLAEQRLAEKIDAGCWRGCGADQRRMKEIAQAIIEADAPGPADMAAERNFTSQGG